MLCGTHLTGWERGGPPLGWGLLLSALTLLREGPPLLAGGEELVMLWGVYWPYLPPEEVRWGDGISFCIPAISSSCTI